MDPPRLLLKGVLEHRRHDVQLRRLLDGAVGGLARPVRQEPGRPSPLVRRRRGECRRLEPLCTRTQRQAEHASGVTQCPRTLRMTRTTVEETSLSDRPEQL